MRLSTAEKSARYRAKDVAAYRAKKNLYAKTPRQRMLRREAMRRWRAKGNNRERSNEFARQYREAHHDEILQANLERYHQRRYGMSRKEAVELRSSGCKLCGSKKKPHIDHCHATGRIRGVLCMYCNTKLGWVEKIGIDRIKAYLAER